MPLNRKIAYFFAWKIAARPILLEQRKRFLGSRGTKAPGNIYQEVNKSRKSLCLSISE